MECQDSEPFREPVDCLDHPTYSQMIDTPMDLGTVREELYGNNYDDPTAFCKDMRLIFTNSKNYNTNKKSRVSTCVRTKMVHSKFIIFFNYFMVSL
jgi:bromodomain and WD repeat domain-containing protein 1/3